MVSISEVAHLVFWSPSLLLRLLWQLETFILASLEGWRRFGWKCWRNWIRLELWLCSLHASSVLHEDLGQCLWTGKLGWWALFFKKRDQRVCSNYRGITILSLSGKIYARVLKTRLRYLNLGFRRNNASSTQTMEQRTSSLLLLGFLKGHGSTLIQS